MGTDRREVSLFCASGKVLPAAPDERSGKAAQRADKEKGPRRLPEGLLSDFSPVWWVVQGLNL